MRKPIEVFIEIRNGVPSDVRTSIATEGAVKVTVIQVDDSDELRERREADGLIASAIDRCPVPLDW